MNIVLQAILIVGLLAVVVYAANKYVKKSGKAKRNAPVTGPNTSPKLNEVDNDKPKK